MHGLVETRLPLLLWPTQDCLQRNGQACIGPQQSPYNCSNISMPFYARAIAAANDQEKQGEAGFRQWP